MKIETRNIDTLIPATYNPRKDLTPDDPEYIKIKRSITEFGYVDPIIVNDRTGTVVGGHQRLKVLRDLGYTEVEVSVVDLDDEHEKALNVALNKITGDWNLGTLKDLLLELDNGAFDVTLTGFDLDELEDLINQMAPEESDVEEDSFDVEGELQEPATSQTGDIWELGRHRLVCGDATSAEDIGKLMDGARADMILTDPPYNVDYVGKTKDALKIQNDKMSDSRFRQFLIDAFRAASDVLKPGGVFYIWHADSEGLNFRQACAEVGWQIRQCLVWVKNTMVMGRQDYQWKHEPCLYGWKDGAAHYFIDDRTQTTVTEDAIPDFRKMKKEELLAFLKELYSDKQSTSVIHEDKPMRSAEHPTMKPLKLLERQIKNSTKRGELVLDSFNGSGSTMMTAEQLGRICYGAEIDPKYCDVTVKRYINLVGGSDGVFLLRAGKRYDYDNLPQPEEKKK